jgi:hypothetical protein
MSEVTVVATSEGRFTAQAAGPADGPLVLLLHGYPQTRHTWRQQVPALGAAGYRAVAPDQRGYSPGVRPDPAKGLDAYAIDRLVQDVLELPTRPPGPGRGSTWSATTGRARGLGHRASPSRAASLADRPLAPASGRLPARVPGERRRPAAPFAAPQGLPRPDHRPPAPGGRGAPAPGPAHRTGRIRGRGDRVPLGAGGARGPGGRARVVPGGGDPHRGGGRPRHRADALHWGEADARRPSAARFTADFVTGPFRFECGPASATS